MLHVMVGTVISLDDRETGYTMVFRQEDGGTVLFHMEKTAALIGCDGICRDWESVRAGMRLAAVLSGDTPMTMSLPPQISGAYGFVLVGEWQVSAGCFDETLTDRALCLRLQIGEETVIADACGNRLTKADLIGRASVVVYGRTTRSIPAQTTPEIVIVYGKN